MNYTIEKVEKNKVKLTITVPVEEFKKAIEKAYRKNVQKFNIPGFRKGKAPKVLIEKMYGEEIFYDDAVNFVFEETYPKVVEESKIEPVDRADVDIVEIGRDKDLVYTATVVVKPEVELGEYKGVEVEKVELTVTDDDVERQLQNMREKNARIITKEDGVIEKGDTAVIDFEGFVDGVAFEGGKGENYSLEIGSNTFISGFEDQLIGKKAGEEVEVNVTFPENYSSAELAGKPAVFKVKINEVKQKELLPLDDEFAKDVSEFETLEELKADTRKKLEESNEQRAKRQFEDAVIKKVVDNANVDIPDVMVEREIDYTLNNMDYRLRAQGINLEQYAAFMGTTVENMKEDYREVSLNRIKTDLVLEKVSETEVITVSDEELNAEIEKMAKQYNQDLDKFKESIGDREKEYIREQVKTQKTIDFLVQNAKVIA